MRKPILHLKSGELKVTQNGEVLGTVLGSCVAVCIFDNQKKIGGMNHYLLPESNPSASISHPLNFGDTSLTAMLKRFKELGSHPLHLQAKIVGGARMKTDSQGPTVGERNIQIAKDLLQKFAIPIVAESIGGNCGRTIEFYSSTGELRLKMESEFSEGLETKKKNKIKVLIVDDSQSVRKILRAVISSDPQIEIVGEAEDPIEAERLRENLKPDVMTLDLHMPKKNGNIYLRELMSEHPMPVIIVSDCHLKDTGPVMNALDAGALDYVQKPELARFQEHAETLIAKIKMASEVNVEKLRPKKISGRSLARPSKNLILDSTTEETEEQHATKKSRKNHLSISSEMQKISQMIAIGASTGGTEALKELLSSLPENIPPILIVQHMPAAFTKSFADRLNELCSFQVKEAEQSEVIRNGCVYIAPGGQQMAVSQKGSIYKIQLSDEAPENRFKPSVDFLFRSFAKVQEVKKSAALLTGMGSDGARELLTLRNSGAFTIAQDESTSVVFGMPKSAIELGAAQQTLPLDQIASALISKWKRTAA